MVILPYGNIDICWGISNLRVLAETKQNFGYMLEFRDEVAERTGGLNGPLYWLSGNQTLNRTANALGIVAALAVKFLLGSMLNKPIGNS